MDAPRGYELLEQIGAGGRGTVWRARQQSAGGRIVALKRVDGDVAALQREAQTLAALDHPHIVRILECVRDGDGVAIAMTFAAGGSLADLLTRGRLPWRQAFELLVPVADALASVHRRGILHRDIKPANILLTEDGDALLADFGIVGAAGGNGTPGYTAPWIDDITRTSPASDVYALAATCHHAISGVDPRHGAVRERLDQVVPGVPAPVAEAVARGQQPAWTDPFPAASFADGLRHALSHERKEEPPTRPVAPVLVRRSAVADMGAPMGSSVAPEEPGDESVQAHRTSKGRWLVAVPAAAVLITAPVVIAMRAASDLEAPALELPARSRVEYHHIDGDELVDRVRVDGLVVEVSYGSGSIDRFSVDHDAGSLLIGDWDCDGRATLGLFQASPRSLRIFDAWPQDEEALPDEARTFVNGQEAADMVANGAPC